MNNRTIGKNKYIFLLSLITSTLCCEVKKGTQTLSPIEQQAQVESKKEDKESIKNHLIALGAILGTSVSCVAFGYLMDKNNKLQLKLDAQELKLNAQIQSSAADAERIPILEGHIQDLITQIQKLKDGAKS